ncbi:CDP-glycerol glycerophosphotransferase family protein [Chloroflexota bacterium]
MPKLSINRFIARLSQRQIDIIWFISAPFRYLMALLDLIYPKDNKMIIFGSNTGEFASGSPQILFEYMKENHPKYNVHYFLPFEKSLDMYARTKYIVKFIPTFLKAKFLVSSHPPSDFYPFTWSNRKILINTWHGTPLKSMFFADSGDTKSNLKRISRLNKKISAFIVSSKLEAAIMTECFLINPRKFYYLGQPRNDILLKNRTNNVLPHIMGNALEYSKVILYCPTYRRDNPTKFFPFDDLDLRHLNNFLEENKAIILVRKHVYEKELDKQYYSERIIDFGFDVCNDVNSVLPEIDILVTDYSSIYIDYLLLDRPCIFIAYDLDDYKKRRGLLYDDYEFWTPGYHVATYADFIAAIKEILSDKDPYSARRQEINRQLNYHQTDNSCEKVFELIADWRKEKHQ